MPKLLQKISYDEEHDYFTINISNDGGKTWGFQVGCECRRFAGQSEDAEPIAIPYGLLTTVRDNAKRGFMLVTD